MNDKKIDANRKETETKRSRKVKRTFMKTYQTFRHNANVKLAQKIANHLPSIIITEEKRNGFSDSLSQLKF